MNGWDNFLIAEVGASATLAGLIFVGVSINLTRILMNASLPSRAFQALVFLIAILILSSLLLVPRQSLAVVGIEILAVALALWIIIVVTDVNSLKKSEVQYRHYVKSNLVVNQLVVLPYFISGVVVLVRGASGLYGLVPAVLFSFLKAIGDAWVLLVEINR
jgi:hypothetical protein